MPSTIGVATLNATYKVRLRQRDVLEEELNKHFTVSNTGASGNLQAALRAYESLSQAGIVKSSAAIDANYSGASTTIASAGLFPKVGDLLILAFSRTHPVDASRIHTQEFAILAPVPAIYDTATKKPIMVRGVTFALAAGATEALGALVDWLEDSLVLEVYGTEYVGSYTYDEPNTRLISIPKTYDGNPIS